MRKFGAGRSTASILVTLRWAADYGLLLWEAFGTVVYGWTLAAKGAYETGLPCLQDGVTRWQTRGAEGTTPYLLGLMADAYTRAEDAEKGLEAVNTALRKAARTQECWWEAELHRLRGELLLLCERKEGNAEGAQHKEAEGCFRQAVAVARDQNARTLELRATVSLARLWQRQGRQKEAHTMLSAIFHWFTEGFATKDLQEAQGLLGELARNFPAALRKRRGQRSS